MKAGIKSDREKEQSPLWACWTSLEVDSATRDHQQEDLIQPQLKPCSLWAALCLLVPPAFLPIPHKFLVQRSLFLDDALLLSLWCLWESLCRVLPVPRPGRNNAGISGPGRNPSAL